jgi:predicted site-specific integrase-resolvase
MHDAVVLLHRKEAADRLRVSVCTVKRWGAAGLLDERRVGPKLVKITEASVAALIARRKKDQAA